MEYQYYVYIMTNWNNKVLYVGITSDLPRRVSEHKSGIIEGFTQKYNLHKLVYNESFNNVDDAIAREKQLKRWTREKKNKLIESLNPTWQDLVGLRY